MYLIESLMNGIDIWPFSSVLDFFDISVVFSGDETFPNCYEFE